MAYLLDWKRCPFCDGEVARVRSLDQTEFRCTNCKAIVIFKTSNHNNATIKFNKRAGENDDE